MGLPLSGAPTCGGFSSVSRFRWWRWIWPPDLGWYVGARLGGKTAMWTGLISGAALGIAAAIYGGG